MLILTRKCNESIRIGDDVVITVMRIEPGQVRIGIDAPRGLPVHRQEVYERIQNENREAALAKPAAVTQLVKDLKASAPAAAPTPESPGAGKRPGPASKPPGDR